MKMLVVSTALLVGACGYCPNTPLTNAAFHRLGDEVRRILDGGYKDVDDIQEALVAAARGGCGGCIPLLVDHGAQLEHRSGVNHWTPLQHAVHKAQVESVRALVAAGADSNSALPMAAGYGQSDIVRVLLSSGADPHRASDGRNALDAALTGAHDIDRWTSGHCQTSTVRVLLEHAPDLKPLGATVPSGCSEIIAMLAPPPRTDIQSQP